MGKVKNGDPCEDSGFVQEKNDETNWEGTADGRQKPPARGRERVVVVNEINNETHNARKIIYLSSFPPIT